MEVREEGWKEIGTEIQGDQTDADTVDRRHEREKGRSKAGDTRTDSAGTVPLSLPVTQEPLQPWLDRSSPSRPGAGEVDCRTGLL